VQSLIEPSVPVLIAKSHRAVRDSINIALLRNAETAKFINSKLLRLSRAHGFAFVVQLSTARVTPSH
jgi:hypothetical protein